MNKRKIAVFATGWPNEILYEYLTGLRDSLVNESADIYVFMCFAVLGDNSGYFHGELNIFNLPDMENFDAALIFANSLDFPGFVDKIKEACNDANIPVIFTGKKDEDSYFVGSDNYTGTRNLCEHLLKVHNVKDVMFIAGSRENMDSNVRLRAVIDVLEAHGKSLTEENICYTNWDPNTAGRFVIDRVEKGIPLTDAIICANDSMAMIICSELRDHGIKVPEDVIVTGFDNEFQARIYDPSLSSVDQCFDKIGAKTGELLMELFAGNTCKREHRIDCEFIPSESCGCSSAKDFDALRRKIGRDYFLDSIKASLFDIRLSSMEKMVMAGKTYEDLKTCLRDLYSGVNHFEGNVMHIVLDPLYEQTIYDQKKQLRKNGYPAKMDVLFSMDNGNFLSKSGFHVKNLIPQVSKPDENHLYIFMPLHSEERELGYIVFCDDYEKINNSARLRTYVERVNIILQKYLQDRRFDTLHKQLIQMMETDALTQVKNRTAFETREDQIQNSIQSGDSPEFAVVIFDVNNLKLINDRLGHEAGDEYLVNASKAISEFFEGNLIYRIGGDEFATILEDESFQNRDNLVQKFMEEMKKKESTTSTPSTTDISIACGMAVFDIRKDYSLADVFKRADARMYENKKEMKGQ